MIENLNQIKTTWMILFPKNHNGDRLRNIDALTLIKNNHKNIKSYIINYFIS